ncbi:hypothetical protein DL546_002423 [Coniochaeta pulveracea]|uniref:Methyltransferase-like protein n=1 Tax=Coniochaeta pulveracea TaxID=177199 RepID=A0A420Y0B0_9PEZI|nr:hypothetical protein DL546_002423 [Coniochaeta pulveracea]
MATGTTEEQIVRPYKPAQPRYTGHTIVTPLNYYKDPGDGSAPTPVMVGATSVTNERPTVQQTVAVRDITGEEDRYSLDTHGFQLLHHESRTKQFDDVEVLKSDYFPEMVELVKNITGARVVHLFNHTVRRGPSNWHSLGQNNASQRGPLHRVHIDQSSPGALMVLQKELPAEAQELAKRRFQIINVWRPIKTIHKDPLAVADGKTVPDSDLIPASILLKNGERKESFTVLPNPRHRWFYKYRQTPDEVMLIKCFDSDESVPARRAPHTAFADPDELDKEDRESIEVRTLVLY